MRPRLLLVGTDFSEHAERALRLATRLAVEFDARIELIHALDSTVPFFEPYAVTVPPDWMESAKRSAAARLAEEVDRFTGPGVAITAQIIVGAILGSVAERTVREAPCAVLTARSDDKPKHILVGADLAHHSDRALAVGAELAGEFDAKLELVHALHAPVPFVTPYEVVLPDAVIESAFETAERELERMARELAPGVKLTTAVLAEPPHAALCDAAERDGADLIVVGCHGHSGLKHLVIGGVAERVLRHAPCSVLTVREPTG
jgi:nucleotide-binding universal stress UspA family protein